MTKGSAWKSQFLLSAIVFVVGMVATLCFSYFFYEKSRKDWNIQVDQTAERLSNTLLSWLEESYAPVSGLVALVENSNTVEPNEFLNAFESMQSRSTTVLLDEASLLRLNRVGQWQVVISSDALGYPGRYITLTDVAGTLSLASKRPNQFTLSPPFKSESGRTISAIALSASAAGEPTIIVGTLNYDTLFDGMRSGPVPKGIFLKLSGRFVGQPDLKSVVTPPNDRPFQHISTTRVATAGADIEISWAATREFDGGPSYGVPLAGLLGGSGTTAVLTLFIGSLIRRNKQIERKVDEATLALRQSSEALGRERERLQRILDASPVGVAITTDNIARFTNPRMEEMFALRVGSDVPDLYVLPGQRNALLDQLGREGIVRDVGVQLRGPNGEICESLTTLMHMEYDGRQGVLAWVVDVTELKKIQTALSEAKVAAEDATKVKAEFLANMSHEIRTPMNAVIGLAHLCLKTDLSAKQRDYVGKIHNAGTSLLSIINDILDFSKIEAGKLDIENVTFEMDSVMNNISTMVAQKIQDKELELLFNIVKPGIYPAVVRFANADANINSDFKPDVRSLSFSVDLTRDGLASVGSPSHQDFSMQNATTLPINDSSAFLATIKVLTASNPLGGLWSLPFKDKLKVVRTLALAELQAQQKIKPYQKLRYWSTVPFRHGPDDVVKVSAIPSPDNSAKPLQKSNPRGLQDELLRHINEDVQMSWFDFAVQFLDIGKMTYWGRTRDANFWIENASVEWNEAEAPFHVIARLALRRNSQLSLEASAATYFDVTNNSTPDSRPVGSINRARCPAEVASRRARAGGV